jgi:RimJ/RimL family protein N-acetyltransferase
MCREDADQFIIWLNDLEVLENLQLYAAVINAETEQEAITKLAREHNYSIIDKESDAPIGVCGFNALDQLNQTGEVGIFIGNKDFWGRGYGSEALSLLLDYGFRALNLHNIMLTVYSPNKRALACYEKLGFKRIGVRRQSLRRNITVSDVIYMDILPDEFYATYGCRV